MDPARRSRILHYICLIALIAIGGVMRFSYLDKPPIWFDEAATYARSSGKYHEMLDNIREAGFGPLHYHLYWWMQQGMPTRFTVEKTRVPAMSIGEGFPRKRSNEQRAGSDGRIDGRTLVPDRRLITEKKLWLTPQLMRIVPAICGTLMIPAMYWLALELAGGRRNVALLTATLTCFSAYLLNYSRDAKMYQELWFFAALNGATFLWWLRTRGGIPWWLWIVTGTTMIGLHLLGAIMIVVELIIVLTAPRANWFSMVLLPLMPVVWIERVVRWFRGWREYRDVPVAPDATAAPLPDQAAVGAPPTLDYESQFTAPGKFMRVLEFAYARFRWPSLLLFLIGVSLIAVGPYGYFGVFNRYAKSIQESGYFATGLQWIPMYNAGRTGPELVRYAASAFVTGWEWPREPDESQVQIRTLRLLKTGFIAILAVAAIGLLPWPKRPPAPLPADRKNRPIDSLVAMWLILWLVIPAYAVYCASFRRYASPGDWITLLQDVWRTNAWPKFVLPAALLVGIACAARTWKLRAIRFIEFCGVVLAIGLACWGSFHLFGWLDTKLAGTAFARHESLWIPRYLGVTIPALFIILSVLIARLPTRLLRIAAVLLFITVNLGQFGGRVFAGSEPPLDRMVRDAIAWQSAKDGSVKMYYNVQRASDRIGMGPGSAVLGMPSSRYYWAVFTHDPKVSASDIRGFNPSIDSNFPRSTYGIPNQVKNDVARDTKLTRLIVWDSLNRGAIDLTDKVLDVLGPEWKRERDELFAAREHWTWRDLFTVRRREYVKTVSPAPVVPATQPTTEPVTSR